jgi:hypothetical protein
MSDEVLSVIPADPRWQPERHDAFRAVAVAADLVPEADETDIEVRWLDAVTAIGTANASFEIAIWNPGRGVFTKQELAAFAAALGHPVLQVLVSI